MALPNQKKKSKKRSSKSICRQIRASKKPKNCSNTAVSSTDTQSQIEPHIESQSVSSETSPGWTPARRENTASGSLSGNLDQFSSIATPSTSSKKVKYSTEENLVSDSACGFRLFDLDLLSSVISSMACPKCFNIKLSFSEISKFGFSSSFLILCSSCGYSNQFSSSNRADKTKAHPGTAPYEVNIRMVLGMRSIGKGFSAMQNLSAAVNLPCIQDYQSYSALAKNVMVAAEKESEACMKRAADELKADQPDSVVDVNCMFDGSWHTRGHSSNAGFVSAISVLTNKVIDVEMCFKLCKVCDRHAKDDTSTIAYENWLAEHSKSCTKNYVGSAPNMEPTAVKKIFLRSVETRNLRYTQYTGDGDSKSYTQIRDLYPYGDAVEIKKVECVGHVQKRMGTGLRKLKKECGKKKLEDGKTIGGRGRLTEKEIDQLQVYYGLAIRRNKGSLEGMQNDVLAILNHRKSTDVNPYHSYCPKGPESWCGWQRAFSAGNASDYKHKNPLPIAVVDKINPVFLRLSDNSLLTRCVDGLTQNSAESFNNQVWKRCPKEVNTGSPAFRTAIALAVCIFNEGNCGMVKILSNLGINSDSVFTKIRIRSADKARIVQSEKRQDAIEKKKRRSRRQLRLSRDEEEIDREGKTYGAGEF